MTNERVLRIQRLVEAALMFKRVAAAQDDIAALDELKRSAVRFKSNGVFASTLQASHFLASISLSEVIHDPSLLSAMAAAELSEADIVSAQACAVRFVSTASV
jgi:hypothetical protein